MVESTTFEVGERRYVSIAVSSTDKRFFEIQSAYFTLMCGDDVEAEGECEIEQLRSSSVKVSALIQPMRKNMTYRLVFKYTIDPEEYLYMCKVRVI